VSGPSLEIQLEAGDGPYRPGDWVRGRVAVLGGAKSRALYASLRFRERSVDYSATPRTVDGPALNEGDLRSGTSFPFQLQLPADALPGVESAHGSLYWEVEAKSDERGIDTRVQRRFEVAASG
jgi:hypothetical protein